MAPYRTTAELAEPSPGARQGRLRAEIVRRKAPLGDVVGAILIVVVLGYGAFAQLDDCATGAGGGAEGKGEWPWWLLGVWLLVVLLLAAAVHQLLRAWERTELVLDLDARTIRVRDRRPMGRNPERSFEWDARAILSVSDPDGHDRMASVVLEGSDGQRVILLRAPWVDAKRIVARFRGAMLHEREQHEHDERRLRAEVRSRDRGRRRRRHRTDAPP